MTNRQFSPAEESPGEGQTTFGKLFEFLPDAILATSRQKTLILAWLVQGLLDHQKSAS